MCYPALIKRDLKALGDSFGATIVRSDFGVHVNEVGDTNVLGMNFLSSLAGWRVEGNTLVLRP